MITKNLNNTFEVILIEKELQFYEEECIKRGLSKNTIYNNKLQIRKFLESGLNIDEYKSYLMSKKIVNSKNAISYLKPKSINTILNILKSFYNTKGMEVKIDTLKIQKQVFLTNILSENEFKRILKQVYLKKDIRSYSLFILLARSGCRISEALDIDKSQIQSLGKNGGIITIFGKGNKSRQIIISKEVSKILKDYIENDLYFDNSTKLFTSKYGSLKRQSAHNDIKKYTGLARIKKSKGHLHNLRHLFCINAIDNGLNITEVAQIVGHSDINTTKIYTNKNGDQLKNILNSIKY
ncbi:MAG: tyrosine-type recombinase/integrase [Peptostreptococcaceae bacterium]